MAFPKGDHLFNSAAASSSDASFVLLVDSVPDVLRATEAKLPAVACVGTDLSDVQIRKFAALSREVVVAFDNDAAGRSAAKSIVTLLQRRGIKRVIQHPRVDFKDVGEMAASDITAWLSDFALVA